MTGRIVCIISNLYTVEIDSKLYKCRARGKFRNEQISPLVGDFVKIDPNSKYILEILPRKNELKRPPLANIDMAILVTSLKEPDLSLLLLDKMLVNVITHNIEPVICLTKKDLLTDIELDTVNKVFGYYQGIGIEVIDKNETEKLLNTMNNKLSVLTGQTGAGKSTLLNLMDNTLNLKTSPISKSLGRGVHTTRHVELFKVGSGLIADTPGFSALDLSDITKEDLKNSFIEFQDLSCKFSDCNHLKETGCGIKEAVLDGKILKSRYENYVKLSGEII